MVRPHRNQTTEELKESLRAVNEQARRCAATGPKKHEDVLHDVTNGLLDELQRRGETVR